MPKVYKKKRPLCRKYVYVDTGKPVNPDVVNQIYSIQGSSRFPTKWLNDKQVELAHTHYERIRRDKVKSELEALQYHHKDLPKHKQKFTGKRYYYSIPDAEGIHHSVEDDLIPKIQIERKNGRKYPYIKIENKIVDLALGTTLQNKYFKKIKNEHIFKIKMENSRYYEDKPKPPDSKLRALSIFNSRSSIKNESINSLMPPLLLFSNPINSDSKEMDTSNFFKDDEYEEAPSPRLK